MTWKSARPRAPGQPFARRCAPAGRHLPPGWAVRRRNAAVAPPTREVDAHSQACSGVPSSGGGTSALLVLAVAGDGRVRRLHVAGVWTATTRVCQHSHGVGAQPAAWRTPPSSRRASRPAHGASRLGAGDLLSLHRAGEPVYRAAVPPFTALDAHCAPLLYAGALNTGEAGRHGAPWPSRLLGSAVSQQPPVLGCPNCAFPQKAPSPQPR